MSNRDKQRERFDDMFRSFYRGLTPDDFKPVQPKPKALSRQEDEA